MDKEAFWETYRQELERRTLKDWGTNGPYDWERMPKLDGTGPMTKEDLQSRVVETVKRMKDAMARYAPSFQSNVAMKTAAKVHGFTSATALRTALLGP